jgi:predicted dienelactone hydrolase
VSVVTPALAVLLLLVPFMASARCPARATTDAFLAPGPFGVGVRTLTLVDPSRPTPPRGSEPGEAERTLVTEVWYPAAQGGGLTPVRDAPVAAGGPFPLVVDSPGLIDYREGRSYYAIALASRGFVVASPDFPVTGGRAPGNHDIRDVANQPGDVSFIIDDLLRREEWLHGRIARRRIGVSGYSLGGLTTLLVTFHRELRDQRVRAALAIAPVACPLTGRFYRTARVPLLVLQGDQDLLAPYAMNGLRAFERSRRPHELVTLADASHTAFSGFVTWASSTSYDTQGCVPVSRALAGDPFAVLGGTADGVDPSGCGPPCPGPAPGNPPMQPARQHAITTAAVTAFFESTLEHSRDARCFLSSRFAAEYPDVTTATR